VGRALASRFLKAGRQSPGVSGLGRVFMNLTTSAPVYDAATVNRLLGLCCNDGEITAYGPPPTPLPGFVTFFDPGCGIITLRALLCGRVTFDLDFINDGEPFTAAREDAAYRQMRMEPLPGSIGKEFGIQMALQPRDETVPSARAIVTAMVVHFLATGERLFPDYWVRSSDMTRCGNRVIVGHNCSVIDMDDAGDLAEIYYLGLASARQL
jgi:hypothetical protein